MKTLLTTLLAFNFLCLGGACAPKEVDEEQTALAEIESFIQKKTKDRRMQQALMQKARVLADIAAGDTDYDELASRLDEALACRQALDQKKNHRELAVELEDQVFNTKEKRRRYIKYNASFSGTIVQPVIANLSNCNFEAK